MVSPPQSLSRIPDSRPSGTLDTRQPHCLPDCAISTSDGLIPSASILLKLTHSTLYSQSNFGPFSAILFSAGNFYNTFGAIFCILLLMPAQLRYEWPVPVRYGLCSGVSQPGLNRVDVAPQFRGSCRESDSRNVADEMILNLLNSMSNKGLERIIRMRDILYTRFLIILIIE